MKGDGFDKGGHNRRPNGSLSLCILREYGEKAADSCSTDVTEA